MSEVFHFRLTLDQVNEIIALMNDGPYGRVTAVINELSRQVKEEQGHGNSETGSNRPSSGSAAGDAANGAGGASTADARTNGGAADSKHPDP